MKSIRPVQSFVLGGQTGQGLADVDPLSHGLVEMSATHWWVHRGYMFQAWNYNAALASAGILRMLITSGARGAHARFIAACGGDSLLAVYESPTISDNGTLVTPLNRSRASARVANSVVYRDPTISALGTQLEISLVPGGGQGPTIGGDIFSFEEILLAQQTSYLFQVTNLANGAEPAQIKIFFYEPNS